jgi:3-deoxy-manno-octulosonate cytidylyltransferase (CMP-KDO synthetase)
VKGVDRVLVATDDRAIADTVSRFGGEVVMTSPDCRNGSERCAEAIDRLGIDDGVIVNLQGDAPLTPPAAIEALAAAMAAEPGIAVASPMLRCPAALAERLIAAERRGAPGGTTVVTDRRGDALYFSRRVLPWSADGPGEVFMHCGAYAYRPVALARYAAAEPSAAERLEGLEQLRFLDIGIAIRMVTMAEPPGGLWEINHPADIALVEAGFRIRGLA